MRFVFPLLAGMAAVALVGAARPDVSFETPSVDPVAVKIMAAYAQCVVSRDPREAHTLLAADYRTEAYKKTIRAYALDHRNCVPARGKLRFNQMVFAGDMAEALMRRERVTPDLVVRQAARDTEQSAPRCVIRKQPSGVAALLASSPASKEEDAALASLQDSIAACTPQGVTVVSSPVGQRAQLALATYRLLNGPALAPAGS